MALMLVRYTGVAVEGGVGCQPPHHHLLILSTKSCSVGKIKMKNEEGINGEFSGVTKEGTPRRHNLA